jgi:hypothetical protein
MDETSRQVTAALWLAFSEAAGGAPARQVISRVINDAITDHAVDDPVAIGFLTALAKDEDNPAIGCREIPAASAA